jgi:hypothetical protein
VCKNAPTIPACTGVLEPPVPEQITPQPQPCVEQGPLDEACVNPVPGPEPMSEPVHQQPIVPLTPDPLN